MRLKLGIRVAPRTVPKYKGRRNRRAPDPTQRWLTVIRNHAHVIVAMDFFTVVTARFQVLYVSIVMELGRRQILHCGVTTAFIVAKRGFRAVVNYRASGQQAEEVVATIREAGGEAVAIRADVTAPGDVAAMADETEKRWGRVDVLVHKRIDPF